MQQKNKKKKICFFTKFSEKGASSNYRVLIYRSEIEEKYHSKFFCFWNDRYFTKYMGKKKKYLIPIFFQYIIKTIVRIFQLLFIAPKYDVVFIQKCVIPGLNINLLNYLRKRNVKIIFDVDDAVYLNKHDATKFIAKCADRIIVGNEILRKYYSQYCEDVVILPTVDYTPAYEKYYHNTFEEKCIGWLGSQASINNLDILIEPINILVKKHPKITFQYICNEDYGYTDKINNSVFIKWDKKSYIKDMSNFTVGVMPLFDTKFNTGKCGFKLIQYLNLKKPVVASDVGINAKIVSDFGKTVNSTNEWVYALEELLYQSEKYSDCIINIEKKFFQRYGFSHIQSQLIKLLDFNDMC